MQSVVFPSSGHPAQLSRGRRSPHEVCVSPSLCPRLRQAVQFGQDAGLRAWFLMGLGLAEYRSGNFLAAVQALLDAVQADPANLHVTMTAPFSRALSLFRKGKVDEARQLATETAARMKPLPSDEQNPLGTDPLQRTHDDLILWLAYKEAKELIQFGAAPLPQADNKQE
jgi:hypothetical protein